VYIPPRRNWDSPTPSLDSECAPPPEPMGGAHLRAGGGLGESQFRRLKKKLSTLSTLWETCRLGLLLFYIIAEYRFFSHYDDEEK
jgi:hypothetical protein